MSKERRNVLMLRWSLISAAAIALFWTVWYVATGSVPVVTDTIHLSPNLGNDLSFSISRWWDILIGPIVALIGVQSSYGFNKAEHKACSVQMWSVRFFLLAFIVCVISGVSGGIIVGFLGFIGWSILGFVVGIVYGLIVGVVYGLAICTLLVLGGIIRFFIRVAQAIK